MQKISCLLSILLLNSLLTACNTSTTQKSVTLNPETQEDEHWIGSAYYQLKTEILPRQLTLSLLTHLSTDTIPGTYTLKRVTRRLLPNDYMAQARTTLSVQNLTDKPIHFNLLVLSIEHQRLPYSARNLTLAGNESKTIPLGSVNVDLRLNTLNTRIEYIASGADIAEQHKEKEFDMMRNTRRADEPEQNQEVVE